MTQWYLEAWTETKVGLFSTERLPHHTPDKPVMVFPNWIAACDMLEYINEQEKPQPKTPIHVRHATPG